MNFNGLTDKEVEDSRRQYGSNEIPDSEPTTFWQEFKETFGDPMIKILLAIAVLKIPSSLREFGIAKKDLDSLVESGMNVQRLLANNKRTVTPQDARSLYLEVL